MSNPLHVIVISLTEDSKTFMKSTIQAELWKKLMIIINQKNIQELFIIYNMYISKFVYSDICI